MSDTYMTRAQVERAEDWRAAVDAMPFLSFPPGLEVAVIPPFGGAMARFMVRRGAATVSVYADFHDALGCYGEPYWEIHPDPTLEDCDRFDLANIAALMTAIVASLDAQDAAATGAA